MKTLHWVLLLTGMQLLICCGKKDGTVADIAYPVPSPDSIPLVFLPGIVSIDGSDFTAAFSPEGDTFYFTRSKNDKNAIMETTRKDGSWTLPSKSLPFDTLHSNADPFVTADGSIYFISSRPRNDSDTTADYDIYRMRRDGDTWTTPEYLDGINTDSAEYYVSVAASGNIYFASNRDGDFDLFVSEYKDGKFIEPRNLGKAVNSPHGEYDPFIAPDESFLLFNSDRPGGYGEADLYIARNKDGAWHVPVNMGSRINTSAYDYCPNMSPDGKYLFYSSDDDVKWVNSSILLSYP